MHQIIHLFRCSPNRALVGGDWTPEGIFQIPVCMPFSRGCLVKRIHPIWVQGPICEYFQLMGLHKKERWQIPPTPKLNELKGEKSKKLFLQNKQNYQQIHSSPIVSIITIFLSLLPNKGLVLRIYYRIVMKVNGRANGYEPMLLIQYKRKPNQCYEWAKTTGVMIVTIRNVYV